MMVATKGALLGGDRLISTFGADTASQLEPRSAQAFVIFSIRVFLFKTLSASHMYVIYVVISY